MERFLSSLQKSNLLSVCVLGPVLMNVQFDFLVKEKVIMFYKDFCFNQ